MLNKSIFNNVCKRLGFYPNIDCFANRLNHQVSSYISYRPDPTAKFVDSFSFDLDEVELVGMSRIQQEYIRQGYSSTTVILIMSSWRQGTIKQYEPVIKKTGFIFAIIILLILLMHLLNKHLISFHCCMIKTVVTIK